MKLCRVLVICCVLCTVKLGNAKKGFIFTSPEVLGSQRMEYFTLIVFGVPTGGEVTVRLLRNNDTDILAESRINVVPDHTTWVAMFVPPITDVNKATLHIFGNFSDGYTIDDRKVVGIHVNHVTLIQTDKPFYKPGQTVRFRVLPMDGELKPLGKDAHEEKQQAAIYPDRGIEAKCVVIRHGNLVSEKDFGSRKFKLRVKYAIIVKGWKGELVKLK